MSHITLVDTTIKDLEALKKACEAMGCELVENQHSFKWYGSRYGTEFTMPKGFTQADMGKCDHAIRVKNASKDTYEIGVVRRRDGVEGYTFMYDFWNGGYGLQTKVGNGCETLLQEYELQIAEREAMEFQMAGYTMEREQQTNGEVHVVLRR